MRIKCGISASRSFPTLIYSRRRESYILRIFVAPYVEIERPSEEEKEEEEENQTVRHACVLTSLSLSPPPPPVLFVEPEHSVEGVAWKLLLPSCVCKK